jgi:hypothetical protein
LSIVIKSLFQSYRLHFNFETCWWVYNWSKNQRG